MYIYLKHIIKSILGEKRYNSLRKNKILSDFAKIDDNIKYKINNKINLTISSFTCNLNKNKQKRFRFSEWH